MRNGTALLVDIGSTYTKVVVVDLAAAEVLAQGRSVTTVEWDVTLGLKRALAAAGIGLHKRDLAGFTLRLACSSAAGGLSLVAIGLVPELTSECARRAALGAGAVVQDVYSYQLTRHEVAKMEALQPDIILLAGGTDGGEATTIVHNAVMLAESRLRVPVVVAGRSRQQASIRLSLTAANSRPADASVDVVSRYQLRLCMRGSQATLAPCANCCVSQRGCGSSTR